MKILFLKNFATVPEKLTARSLLPTIKFKSCLGMHIKFPNRIEYPVKMRVKVLCKIYENLKNIFSERLTRSAVIVFEGISIDFIINSLTS